MSLELSLLVTTKMGDGMYSQTQIQLEGADRSLLDEIQNLEQFPLQPGQTFHTYLGKHGYSQTEETPYGERICFVTAGSLAQCIMHYGEWFDYGVAKYLEHLDRDRLIGLYWS